MNLLNMKRLLTGILVGLCLKGFVATFSTNVVGRYDFSFSPWYSIWNLFEPFWTVKPMYWFIAIYFVFNLLRYYFSGFWTELTPTQPIYIIIPSILFVTFEIIIFGLISVRIYSIESFIYLHIWLIALDLVYMYTLTRIPDFRKMIIKIRLNRRLRKVNQAKKVLMAATNDNGLKAELDNIHSKIVDEFDELEESMEKISLVWNRINVLELVVFVIMLFTYHNFDLTDSPLVIIFVFALVALYCLDFALNWKGWEKIFGVVFSA